LLWRIQNGELPAQLHPPVVWLLIGTNDLGNTWCSPELVVVGIIRIVEEILRSSKPAATVVINGLLPRSFNDQGYVARGRRFTPALWEDIKAINEELQLYSDYRENVEFFTTTVFFKDASVSDSKLQIDKEIMPDFLHPNAKGYQLWGEDILAKLHEIAPSR
jgi:lysophospholipase L1-like esterase